MGFLEALHERGLIAQVTHEPELTEHLASGTRTAYAGFDPTADSLHVGHLLPVMVLAHMQRAGHRVIALLGGGTAMVGDPTGKSEMRQLLTTEVIAHNKACFRGQFAKFLDFSSPERGILRDNADWLTGLEYLPFLRDIGRHFSVNRMLTADCFKTRLEKGLSFLEFNYMLLQSYDFLHLFREESCSLQLGGDDQWSNMLAGVDLIRRLETKPAFCLTMPLLQTSDGKKMGKTEKGAVWLDENKTSPYEYFQYWRNLEDAMAIPCLRYFTFLPKAEIDKLALLSGSEINEAKKILAFETTKLLHGNDKAEAAKVSAEALFSTHGGSGGSEPTTFFSASEINAGMGVGDFLVRLGAGASKGEIRRLVEQGGFTINGEKVPDMQRPVTMADFKGDEGCLVKKGKKHYYRGRIS